jgi:hypothetical protein
MLGSRHRCTYGEQRRAAECSCALRILDVISLFALAITFLRICFPMAKLYLGPQVVLYESIQRETSN